MIEAVKRITRTGRIVRRIEIGGFIRLLINV
jgi:hypothetical protein